MNATKLVAELRDLGPQEQNVIFAFLADHAYEIRLMSGGRVVDPLDFKAERSQQQSLFQKGDV